MEEFKNENGTQEQGCTTEKEAPFVSRVSQMGGCGGQKGKPFTMQDLQIPSIGEKGIMMESEKQIAEYLTRCGLVAEDGISNEEKAKTLQRRRAENYHNIQSLLRRYRSLRRTYAMFCEDFADALAEDTHGDSASRQMESIDKKLNYENIFETLSQQLELLSVTEERRFESIYAPQIAAGRKIELALRSMRTGLRALERENEEFYQLINITYIEGEKKPTVREIMSAIGCTSHSSYYKRLDAATRKLTEFVFGFASSKAELISILVYFRQQTDDSYFPDHY